MRVEVAGSGSDDIEVAEFGAGLLDLFHQAGDDFGVVFGEVFCFAGVVVEVVKLDFLDLLDEAAPPTGSGGVCGAGKDEFPLVVADAGEEAAGVVEVVVAWADVAFSEEEVGGVAAIEGAVLREFGFGELGEGGEEVEGAEELVAFASGFDFFWPAGNEGDLGAAIPGGHFIAAERGGAAGVTAWDEGPAVGVHRASGFDPRAVVGGEDDEGVVVDVQLLELVEDLAGGPIDLLDCVAVGAVFGFAFEVFGCSDGDVREVVGEVEEEGLVFIFLDVVDRFGGVVGRDLVPALDRFDDDFLIAENWAAHFGVFDVDGEAIELRGAVEVVEALSVWHGFGGESAGAFSFCREVPFPDDAGGVARGF